MVRRSLANDRAAALRAADLTYPEVGATRDAVLPAGYRALRRSVVLPSEITFDAARHDLLSWQVQQRAGIHVRATGDVEEGAVADLRLGIGPFSVAAPCRVVYVLDEADQCGFAYGTLPGHPECGEESFVLRRDAHTTITFTITAFSRPATALSRLAGPVGHYVQGAMTSRYLRALG